MQIQIFKVDQAGLKVKAEAKKTEEELKAAIALLTQEKTTAEGLAALKAKKRQTAEVTWKSLEVTLKEWKAVESNLLAKNQHLTGVNFLSSNLCFCVSMLTRKDPYLRQFYFAGIK